MGLVACLATLQLLPLWQLCLLAVATFWGGLWLMAIKWAGVPPRQLGLSRVSPMMTVCLELMCTGAWVEGGGEVVVSGLLLCVPGDWSWCVQVHGRVDGGGGSGEAACVKGVSSYRLAARVTHAWCTTGFLLAAVKGAAEVHACCSSGLQVLEEGDHSPKPSCGLLVSAVMMMLTIAACFCLLACLPAFPAGAFVTQVLPVMWLGHSLVCMVLLLSCLAMVALHLTAYLQDPGYTPLPDAGEAGRVKSLRHI